MKRSVTLLLLLCGLVVAMVGGCQKAAQYQGDRPTTKRPGNGDLRASLAEEPDSPKSGKEACDPYVELGYAH